jgi:hypothetical protein
MPTYRLTAYLVFPPCPRYAEGHAERFSEEFFASDDANARRRVEKFRADTKDAKIQQSRLCEIRRRYVPLSKKKK